MGLAIVAAGAVLFVIALTPGSFGLRRGALFPPGGGFLGVFLIFWGVLLLVRVAWWTARRRAFGGRPGPGFDPAVLAARRRYASGEITREQYQQIVSDLRRPPGPLP